jgi:hypothetical protein
VLFSTSELIELAILFPKTKASSREFEASLFAPCAPVEETSPHAHRPFIDDYPQELRPYDSELLELQVFFLW